MDSSALPANEYSDACRTKVEYTHDNVIPTSSLPQQRHGLHIDPFREKHRRYSFAGFPILSPIRVHRPVVVAPPPGDCPGYRKCVNRSCSRSPKHPGAFSKSRPGGVHIVDQEDAKPPHHGWLFNSKGASDILEALFTIEAGLRFGPVLSCDHIESNGKPQPRRQAFRKQPGLVESTLPDTPHMQRHRQHQVDSARSFFFECHGQQIGQGRHPLDTAPELELVNAFSYHAGMEHRRSRGVERKASCQAFTTVMVGGRGTLQKRAPAYRAQRMPDKRQTFQAHATPVTCPGKEP